MPDINLLDDTKTPEGGPTKPRTSPPSVAYTAPDRQPSPEPEPRLRSSFWSRMTSLFGPKAPKAAGTSKKREQPLKPVIKSMVPDSRVYTEPELTAARPGVRSVPTPAPTLPGGVPMPGRSRMDRQVVAQGTPEKAGDDAFMVNLLPDDLAGKVNPRQKLLLLGTVVGSCAIVIAVTAVGLSLYKSNIVRRTEEVRTQRAALELQIRSSRDEQKQSIALEERAQTVSALLNRHIYWTKFFSKLERYTDPEVSYNAAFAGDINGTLSLRAVAADYRALARQMMIFEEAKDFVSKAVTTSATVSEGGPNGKLVNFGVELTLVPDIFNQSPEEFQAMNSPSTFSQ
jgi:hypothetical protein